MAKTKNTLCKKCNETFEYKASEILSIDVPNGNIDVTGCETTQTKKYVKCQKCTLPKIVYDELDINGEFID